MILVSVALVLALRVQAAEQPGERLFVAHCSGCHGLDGGGGEHAPNIATSARVQGLSNSDLGLIVHDGITAGGMPAFGASLTPAEIQNVVDYLRVLSGSGVGSAPIGNANSGAKLFFGSARCFECHMVAGRGRYFGADLTYYGSARTAEALRESITYPAKLLGPLHGYVRIVMKDGAHFTGIARNQDNFSVQLQSSNGAFHFFQRSEIASMTDQPIPGHTSSNLSPEQLNDIAAYLASLPRKAKAE